MLNGKNNFVQKGHLQGVKSFWIVTLVPHTILNQPVKEEN